MNPLVGVLGFGSKAFEAITTRKYAENEQRTRRPRAFYLKNWGIGEYNDLDAHIMESLRKIDEKEYSCLRLYGIYFIHHQDKNFYFIISVEYLLMLDEAMMKVLWNMPSKNYRKTEDLDPQIAYKLEVINKGVNLIRF